MSQAQQEQVAKDNNSVDIPVIIKETCWKLKEISCLLLEQVGMFAVAFGIHIGLSFIPEKVLFSPLVRGQCEFTGEDQGVGILKQWLWFKLAHIYVFYRLTEVVRNKKSLMGPLIGLTVFGIMFLADLVLFILSKFYAEWQFTLIYTATTLLSMAAMSKYLRLDYDSTLRLLGNGLLLTSVYALVYIVGWLAINATYRSMSQPYESSLVFVYIYPLFDLLMDLIVRTGLKLAHHNIRPFICQTYWLIYGIRVGLLTRIYYQEAEFYYLLLAVAFKDFALTWLVKGPWPFLHPHDANFVINFWPCLYMFAVVQQYKEVASTFQKLLPQVCSLKYQWRRSYIVPDTEFLGNPSSSLEQNWAVVVGGLLAWLPTRKYRLDEFSPLYFLYFCHGIYLFYQGMTAGVLVSIVPF